MRIYFSGGGGLVDTPEVLIPKQKPHVMLTFHNIHQQQSATIDRLKEYLKRKKNENKTRRPAR
jgi:hypothetical protein